MHIPVGKLKSRLTCTVDLSLGSAQGVGFGQEDPTGVGGVGWVGSGNK